MFILALLSMALLPILIQGLLQSTSNSLLATANGLVGQQLESARTSTSCSAIANTSTTVIANHGIGLVVSRTVGSCPSVYPGTVSVSAKVTRADTSAVVSLANTVVFVAGP